MGRIGLAELQASTESGTCPRWANFAGCADGVRRGVIRSDRPGEGNAQFKAAYSFCPVDQDALRL